MENITAKTKELCRIYDIRPARSKGQNFLINEGIYQAIINAAQIKKEDTILEVGPGLGFLTAELSKKAARIIAVELDDKLAGILTIAIDSQDVKNVEIINQDILNFNTAKYLKNDEEYRIVANLPYNITSIFLRTFLTSARPPKSLVLMLQKEVAERIITTAPDMTMLSLSVQYYGTPKIVKIVPSSDFWPAPTVDSAILHFSYDRPHPTPESLAEAKNFFRIARIAFRAKRKMLKNNLQGGLKLSASDLEKALLEAGINLKARAEDLSLEQWQLLVASITPFML
jgi:16S rRNA (adenine1518-N6/adenine1519-N6)-dimethyltransferase